MQVDRMRHDGGADDADREQQRLRIGELRHDGMEGRRSPIDRGDEHLDQVAKPDDAHQAADDQLDRPEAEAFEHQQAVGHDRGDDHPGQQRHVEQQGQPMAPPRNSARSVAMAAISLTTHIAQTTGCGK